MVQPPAIEGGIRLNSGNTSIGDGGLGDGYFENWEPSNFAKSVRIYGFTSPEIFPALASYEFTLALGLFFPPAPQNLQTYVGVTDARFDIYDVGRVSI